ncbi:MAG: phosphatidate cytidylyltransferase [Candidatus Korobacteraceae bacterium]
MKRVLTAVILIPLVILALFKAPLWLFTLLVMGVALLAAREYLDIAQKTGFRPFRRLSYLLLAWIFVALAMSASKLEVSPLILFSLLALIAPLVLFSFALMVAGMTRDPLSRALPDAAVSFMMLPYVCIPLGLMIVLRNMYGPGALFLFYLMVIVWAGDIAALYVGRAIGKHKLAPRISPGKTWEGTIASALGSIIIGLLLFHWAVPIQRGLSQIHLLVNPSNVFRDASETGPALFSFYGPTWLIVVLALCVNVVAQLGDLVESALKRGAGVKDSGSLLPGHGGVLDRIDALLFAMPVGWLFYASALRFTFRIVRY